MLMTTLLLFGFLIGMRHALEADHVAALASLNTDTKNLRSAVKQGATWGLGHTLTLFIICSFVICIDSLIPEHIAQTLELLVGVMLLFLGLDVLKRLYNERIHFHVHSHKSGKKHFHAHTHKRDILHNPEQHEHLHSEMFPYRALFIGMMHGMAGSAALLLLSLNNIQSISMNILYVTLFGLGSIVGMTVLSVIIAIPFHLSSSRLTRLHNVLQTTVGVVTLLLGGKIIIEVGII